MKLGSFTLGAALLAATTSFAQAQVMFSGDLSGDNTMPTDLGVFTEGINTVTGSVVNARGVAGGEPADADVFTFSIAQGTQLEDISIVAFDGRVAFFSIDEGTTYPLNFAGLDNQDNLGQLLGSTLIGFSLDSNLLPFLSTGGDAGSGFTAPLGAGNYSVYIQETSPFSPDTFTVAFTVEAVPEPSTALLAGLALTGLVARRKRA